MAPADQSTPGPANPARPPAGRPGLRTWRGTPASLHQRFHLLSQHAGTGPAYAEDSMTRQAATRRQQLLPGRQELSQRQGQPGRPCEQGPREVVAGQLGDVVKMLLAGRIEDNQAVPLPQ